MTSRTRTILASMLAALDAGDSDTYWQCFSLLLAVHDELIQAALNEEAK